MNYLTPKEKREIVTKQFDPTPPEETETPVVIKLKLVGLDGNAFFLLGKFRKEAQRQGVPQDKIDAITDDAKSGNYDHLLQVLIAHTEDPGEVEDEEDDDPWVMYGDVDYFNAKCETCGDGLDEDGRCSCEQGAGPDKYPAI